MSPGSKWGPAPTRFDPLLNNKPAVGIGIFQAPGSNALQVSDEVRATMKEIKTTMPEGVDYSVVYDPTRFVRESISEVVKTLFEATLLVVIVVVVFLQTWRASIIPLVAVPISIVGTFAVLLMFGFSINTLSLFGLVLAIGIVVDDAIVVVENVERNIEEGLAPLDAAHKAMDEVSGPIIAIALVLCAVFVPIAFISGLTGQFYRQFALTIAFSTLISAFNSLTLSPGAGSHPAPAPRRAARPAHPHHRPARWAGSSAPSIRSSSGAPRSTAAASRGRHHPRTRGAGRVCSAPVRLHRRDVPHRAVGLRADAGQAVPRRLRAVARRGDARPDRLGDPVHVDAIGLKQEGVQDAVAFPGLSINGFVNASNAGIVFFPLTPFEDRTRKDLSGLALAGALNGQFSQIQGAFVAVFPPPPVQRHRHAGRVQGGNRGPRRPR